jgi:hypothetical protein
MGYIDGIHGTPYITIYGSTMDPMGYRKGFDEDEMEHKNKIGKGRKLY